MGVFVDYAEQDLISMTIHFVRLIALLLDGVSHSVLSVCNFKLTNGLTEVDIQVGGVDTTTEYYFDSSRNRQRKFS